MAGWHRHGRDRHCIKQTARMKTVVRKNTHHLALGLHESIAAVRRDARRGRVAARARHTAARPVCQNSVDERSCRAACAIEGHTYPPRARISV